MLRVGRALAFAIVAALCLPMSVVAQQPDVPDPSEDPDVPEPDPQTPEQVQCQPPVESCLPDLVAANPNTEATDERFPARPCADFVNLGEAPTAQPFRYLLLIDNVAVAEVQMTSAYRRGEGDSACWGDFMLPAGRHTMEVKVDSNDEVIEEDETNNARASVFYVAPAPRVDLRLEAFRVTPEEGGVGMTQFFYVNVSNVGNAGSPFALVSLEDDNGPLANWTMPPLQPGQKWMAAHATRPEYRPVGTFVARAVVDPLNNVSELNEQNNEALLEYTVLEHPAPDYDVTNVTVTGNRTEMRGIRVDVAVENVGDRAVRGTTVRLVNQTNVTIAQGVTRSIIYPGTTGTVQFYLVLKAGVHDLRVVADPNDFVIERNESNNEHNVTIEIQQALHALDQPNLIIERVYAMPEDPRPGEAVSVGALIHNIGTNRSNATRVNFLVDDELIGSASVPALRPDAYYSAYIPWIATAAGAYSIVAVADQGNAIEELDETDNALGLDFLVTSVRPPETTQPPPPTSPPPTTTPPVTPTAPTTPTPTTPTPTTPVDTASRVIPGELIISTSPAPGGARGVISLSLRNPTIEPVGQLTVQFKIDGKLLEEVLVRGIPGAGTVAATTGDEEIVAGDHKVTAEVRIIGSQGASVVREGSYSQAAGEGDGIPGFTPLALLLAACVAVAVARRRR